MRRAGAARQHDPIATRSAWVLAALALIVIALPLVVAVLRAARAGPGVEAETTPTLELLLTTVFVPIALSLGATTLGWLTAWHLRACSATHAARALAALAVVALLPSYLAYAGFGLARAPGTWLGDALAHGPLWLNIHFTKSLALLGLTLFFWPVATLVLLEPVRRVPAEHTDQLRLMGATRARQTLHHLAALRGHVLACLGLIAILALGSLVPLHLAQVKTLAIDLWAALALDPTGPSAWRRARPLLITAAAGAWWIASFLTRQHAPEPITIEARSVPHRVAWTVLALAWCVAVLVPLALFALNIKQWRYLAEFWRENDRSILDSLCVAALTAVASTLLTLLTLRAADAPRGRTPLRLSLTLFLLALLIPGVLLGSSLNAAFAPCCPSRSIVPLVIGHIARFGALPLAAGLWLARCEPITLRDARRLTGTNLRTWWTLAAAPNLPSILGIALACGCLSFHEIEVTVQLQPPGFRALAQVILDHLHMNSIRELAAAATAVTLASVTLAVAAAWSVPRILAVRSTKPEARA